MNTTDWTESENERRERHEQRMRELERLDKAIVWKERIELTLVMALILICWVMVALLT